MVALLIIIIIVFTWDVHTSLYSILKRDEKKYILFLHFVKLIFVYSLLIYTLLTYNKGDEKINKYERVTETYYRKVK